MIKEIVSTKKTLTTLGPYSPAIKAKGFLFVSGQVPIDPLTGQVVNGGIEEQTRQVIKNAIVLLEAAGTSLNNVIKTTLFITSMDEFPTVNETYSCYFNQSPPARSCVEVSALPKGAKIEMELIASLGD